MKLTAFELDYETKKLGKSLLVHADCLEWLQRLPAESIDAVVTDPPYGVKEYDEKQLRLMQAGGPGMWRIPPAFDGNERAPLPRFTALTEDERNKLKVFFKNWGQLLLPALKPGAHVFIACNSFMSQLVFHSLMEAGLEFRTEIIRLVQTLRGGDRPKLGEEDFPNVCSLPRGGYEPWGLFRKPLPKGLTVRECLRKYGTGGLRRKPDGNPFFDVIVSERTPSRERDIAEHPSLKPQSLMRQLVHAALPLGRGVIVDPFMGAGTTIAAAEAVGYACVGVERYKSYFDIAKKAIPQLIALKTTDKASVLVSNGQTDMLL